MWALLEYITESAESAAKTAQFNKYVKSAHLDGIVELVRIPTRPTVYQLHVNTDDERILNWVDNTMKSVFGFSTTKSIKELQDEYKVTAKADPRGGIILFCQFTANDLTRNLKNKRNV